jgi:hypothetical protein
MSGQFTQPILDCGLLLGSHFFKHYTHAENSKTAAGMQIEHFAGQFACAYAIADAKT